jgi:hypothetical protein
MSGVTHVSAVMKMDSQRARVTYNSKVDVEEKESEEAIQPLQSISRFPPTTSMILPRKVPWRSQAELAQLRQWIYVDPSDYESRQRAIRRVSSSASFSLPFFSFALNSARMLT